MQRGVTRRRVDVGLVVVCGRTEWRSNDGGGEGEGGPSVKAHGRTTDGGGGGGGGGDLS